MCSASRKRMSRHWHSRWGYAGKSLLRQSERLLYEHKRDSLQCFFNQKVYISLHLVWYTYTIYLHLVSYTYFINHTRLEGKGESFASLNLFFLEFNYWRISNICNSFTNIVTIFIIRGHILARHSYIFLFMSFFIISWQSSYELCFGFHLFVQQSRSIKTLTNC